MQFFFVYVLKLLAKISNHTRHIIIIVKLCEYQIMHFRVL